MANLKQKDKEKMIEREKRAKPKMKRGKANGKEKKEEGREGRSNRDQGNMEKKEENMEVEKISECEAESDLISNRSRHCQSRHIEIEQPHTIRPAVLTHCTRDRCET